MNDKIIFYKDKLINFYFQNDAIFSKVIDNISPSVKVIDGVYFDFDVISDSTDAIYLICQTLEGGIILMSYSNNSWQKETLLISKTKTAYKKSFKLIMCSKLICAFYTIVKDAKPLLIFQHINSGSSPIVVDYITNARRSFFVYTNENFDIDLYYQDLNGDLVLKTYIWSKKAFGEKSIVHSGANNPFAIAQKKLVANLNGEIIYIDNFSSSKICKTFKNEHPIPYCCNIFGEWHFMWQEENCIYYTKQAADGFSSPQKFSHTFLSPSLLEIKKTPIDTAYMFCVKNQNSISLLSPSSPILLSDFFKGRSNIRNISKESHKSKIDIVIEKLEAIEKLLSGKN